MTDLDKLRELVKRVTPGKWKDKPSAHGTQYRYVEIGGPDGATTLEQKPDDARLLAMAPTLAADLLAMSEENARLKREVDAAEKRADDQYFRAAGLQEKLGEIARRVDYAMLEGHTFESVAANLRQIAEIAKGIEAMTATPEPANSPFVGPFRVRRGTGRVEDADGMRVCNLGNDEAAQWLATRLNAPLAGELTEEERKFVDRLDADCQRPRLTFGREPIRALIAIITRLTGATR